MRRGGRGGWGGEEGGEEGREGRWDGVGLLDIRQSATT